MAKDFYTKCGLKFQKSANSAVTGYEYPEEKPDCKSCPFPEAVERQREGVWVKVKQCQAGEKKPNHRTDCGSIVCTDTNNLHIQTLDMAFIADLEKFIQELPGIQGHYFNSIDSNDCRKNYVVGFEKNKKGLVAKKAIIEKFFPNGKSFECYKPELPEETLAAPQEKEEKKVYFNGSECSQECENKRDGKCTITSVYGSALKVFALDEKAPSCENMKSLKVRYLKDIRQCSHAHIGCNAVILSCSLRGEYCCYSCTKPCNSRCGFAKELVPYGKLKPDDKGHVQADTSQPTYIFTMDIDSYDQVTALNSHLQHIRNKCTDIIENYVEIGYTLLNIKGNKLFKARGYSNLLDCVESELNIKKSTAYNLIKIAEKFGDPETKRLKDEYKKYNYVQCLEMSNMTEEELSHVSPEMSKREMKQLKNSNRLEKSVENSNPDVKVNEPAQLIDEAGSSSENSNVIDITEYSVIEEERKEVQQLPAYPESEQLVQNQEADVNKEQEPIQQGESTNNDRYINELLMENENYRLRVKKLEQEKDTFKELVKQIDSKFDKLSKNQIRNSLWDFIGTGMIMFEEN